MRRSLAIFLSFVLCLSLSPQMMADEVPDDFCFWTAINVKKDLGKHCTVGGLAELRLDSNCTRVNQYYFRPLVNYKFNDWLKAGAQVDFVETTSGFQMRFLPELTANYRTSSWSFSLRERYQATWSYDDDSWSHVLRTKATMRYLIPDTGLTIAVAAEPYYLTCCSKVRIYSGFTYAFRSISAIQLQYVREQYFEKKSNNVIYLTYMIKI